MIKILSIVVFLALQNPLTAHDLFLQSNPFRLDRPEAITLTMRLSEAFLGKEVTWKADKTVNFLLNTPSGLIKLDDKTNQNPTVKLKEEGTYVVGWAATPSYIKIDSSHFNEYLDKDGHSNVLKLRKERSQKNKEGTEKYTRFLKTILQVGSKNTDEYKKPFGFKIEIIPQKNPYILKVGETLDVQVLFDGEPLPDVAVMATYDTHSKEHDVYSQIIRTDDSGKSKIILDKPGVWLIRANYMTELKDDSKTEWESFWSNLTFEIRE